MKAQSQLTQNKQDKVDVHPLLERHTHPLNEKEEKNFGQRNSGGGGAADLNSCGRLAVFWPGPFEKNK